MTEGVFCDQWKGSEALYGNMTWYMVNWL